MVFSIMIKDAKKAFPELPSLYPQCIYEAPEFTLYVVTHEAFSGGFNVGYEFNPSSGDLMRKVILAPTAKEGSKMGSGR